MTNLVVYTDGATRPVNPGPSGYGVAVYQNDELVATEKGYLGADFSNNQAEYAGVISGLAAASARLTNHTETLVVKTDSSLLVNQVTGEWNLRSAKIGPLHSAVVKGIDAICALGIEFKLQHVKGHNGEIGNELADQLASSAIREQSPIRTSLRRLLNQSQGKTTTMKGHEKLVEIVKSELAKYGQVISLDFNLTNAVRAKLYQQNQTGSNMVLHFPQLAIVGKSETQLLTLATGFKRPPESGETSVRTMDLAAYETALALTNMGIPVVVAHKPHARGAWLSPRDLGWGGPKTPVDTIYAPVSTIKTGQVFDQDGWPPFVEIQPKNNRDWTTA